MKLKVLKLFRDKFDAKKVYQPGTEVECDDKTRCDDLILRGLCAAVEEVEEVVEEGGASKEETPEVPKAPKSGTSKKGTKK